MDSVLFLFYVTISSIIWQPYASDHLQLPVCLISLCSLYPEGEKKCRSRSSGLFVLRCYHDQMGKNPTNSPVPRVRNPGEFVCRHCVSLQLSMPAQQSAEVHTNTSITRYGVRRLHSDAAEIAPPRHHLGPVLSDCDSDVTGRTCQLHLLSQSFCFLISWGLIKITDRITIL